jgi:hypothetical protein
MTVDVRFGSKADMCSAARYVRYGPIADIQEVGVTKENPGTLPGVWLSEYRFSEHSIRTLSNVCRVGRYSSADRRNSRDHYY